MSSLAIVGWSTHLPRFQLTGRALTALMGGGGKKARAVASHDEDPVTLAAAAARSALRTVDGFLPRSLVLATSNPPYLVKSSAGTVHAALSLPSACRAVDAGGATRSGVTALLAALEGSRPTLVAGADTRTERVGAPGELDGGDAAVAFLVADPAEHPAAADLIGTASVTVELLDRWRPASERFGGQADERATEAVYLQAAETALAELFGDAERAVDVLVVSTEHKRVRGSLARRSRVAAGRVLTGVDGVGCAGAADAGLLLAAALETASAGKRILLVSLADGVDALLFQVAADGSRNTAPTVRAQAAQARQDLAYAVYLGWRGLIERDVGRRPPLAAPAPMPAARNKRWKFGLVGARCGKCDTVQLPPERVCRACGATDAMDEYEVAEQTGTVRQVTTDRLAWSPQPPLIQAIVAFDDGGRMRCEITDAFDGEVKEGDRVAMSFRVLRTVDGIHNYFWKAVPLPGPGTEKA
ncbi:OB-fold domain-containing protein [Streptomyces sp. UG1]|uniref:OB-fold domain-containing protein n=1 Tax=Streptomyces sp. UG1 TaxID=3417652 RepID=UPI003CF0571D